jgi:carbon-monoxide dehydrogenase iron sulfur subunit
MARLVASPIRCSGCRLCELICSFWHEDEFNPSRARIRIEINRSIGPGTLPDAVDVPHVCEQCNPAPCEQICPEGAIVRDSVTHALLVKDNQCVGCGLCVEECPYHMIHLNQEKETAQKCDLCGGQPLCVSFCPRDALCLEES